MSSARREPLSAVRSLPIGVMISGQGTNLNAILQRCDAGTLSAMVRVVISNRPGAVGLEFGRSRAIPTYICARESYSSRAAQQLAMKDYLVEGGVELVVLAGFDQILGQEFLQESSYRIINLHPSLLPAFGGGMNAVRDALDYGVRITGCTVHFVLPGDPRTDGGPIILQESVPVLEDDTEASLLARVHEAEYRILPETIQLYAEGRLTLEGRRVRIARAGA